MSDPNGRSPLDTSRRGFLTNAAALTAAGTAMALTAHVGPAEALAVVKRISDENSFPADADIEPFFIDTRIRIRDSLSEWRAVNAECNMRDRAVRDWEKRNPLPDLRLPGDEGYSETYRSDWHTRHQNAMRQARLVPPKVKRSELAAAYIVAVKEFAAFDATNLTELRFKTETAAMMDSADGIIARSVLFDIMRLGEDGAWGNASDLKIEQVAP